MTDHSVAVLTEGVPEAEATPENDQDVILPPEDQASTLETVEEPNSNSEQGPKNYANELENQQKETESRPENEQDVNSLPEDQASTLQPWTGNQ